MSAIDHQLSVADLENLSTDSGYYQDESSYMNIRDKAIHQAAESLGMQAGLAKESKDIDQTLEGKGQYLDQIYNFNLLIYNNNLLPPVIVKSKNNVKISSDGNFLELGGQSYRVIKQVRFVSTPPSWRTYLIKSYPNPQLPDKVLLPRNSEERALWQNAVAKGWNEGVKQAIKIYQVDLHRLTRDFNGMVLYKTLALKHMVSPYFVKKKSLGVVGDGNHMTIDDRTLRIADKPQLQVNSKFWSPITTKSTDQNKG